MNIFYFEEDKFNEIVSNSLPTKLLNKHLFNRYGVFILGNIRKTAISYSKHMNKGLDVLVDSDSLSTFTNLEMKAQSLVIEISKQIIQLKLKSVAMLFSGGTDSILLSKVLLENGVDVIAYHSTPYPKNHPKSISTVKSIQNLCGAIGIKEVNFAFGGITAQEYMSIFKNRFISASAIKGLASLYLNSDISKHKIVAFAQGADTLSNCVHTQHRYFNSKIPVTKKEVFRMLRFMLTSTFSRELKIIGYLLSRAIISENYDNLVALTGTETQNVSRFLGMHLVHTPSDSKAFYELAKLSNQIVFNPFHTLPVENLFMSPIEIEQSLPVGKHEIYLALKRFDLHHLNFMKASFKVRSISETRKIISDKDFNKELYKLLFS